LSQKNKAGTVNENNAYTGAIKHGDFSPLQTTKTFIVCERGIKKTALRRVFR